MAGTRVGAVELKRVNAANLPNIKCNVSDRQNRALVELRCKDTIYRLMTKNDDTRELDSYVQQLIECLARDKIFPVEQAVIDTRVYERRDMTQAQEVLTHVKTSHNVILKRAFLWLGLRICPSFINTFCPPPSDRLHRRVVQPDALGESRGVVGRRPEHPQPRASGGPAQAGEADGGSGRAQLPVLGKQQRRPAPVRARMVRMSMHK